MIQSSTLHILVKPVLLVVLLSVGALPAIAQRRITATTSIEGNGSDDEQQLSPVEEEMRVKREIAATEKAHKENVTRARQLVSLSESLVKAYKANNELGRDDLKNLERAEKLVKKIRDDLGGEDPDTDRERAPLPKDVCTGLEKLLKLADSLKERVEKTPKRVVSAAIIDEANVLLELIRAVRSMHTRTT